MSTTKLKIRALSLIALYIAQLPPLIATAKTPTHNEVLTVQSAGSRLDSYVVTTLINKRIAGTFIIDTGSTYMVISPTMARKLGLDIEHAPREAIMTANGMQYCPKVILAKVLVQDVELDNVEAVVHEIDADDPLLSGLLGLSVLSRLNFCITKGQVRIGQ